jgi:hypothetical protein
MHLIWVRPERKYFCKRGWAGKSVICPTGKSVDPFNKLQFLGSGGDTRGCP